MFVLEPTSDLAAIVLHFFIVCIVSWFDLIQQGHGCHVQLTRGDKTPQGQLHPVVKKLSPGAPVYTLKENETSTGVALTHIQKRGRHEEALRVPQGNFRFPAASLGASRLPSVSPRAPSPSSGGTSSSSGMCLFLCGYAQWSSHQGGLLQKSFNLFSALASGRLHWI